MKSQNGFAIHFEALDYGSSVCAQPMIVSTTVAPHKEARNPKEPQPEAVLESQLDLEDLEHE